MFVHLLFSCMLIYHKGVVFSNKYCRVNILKEWEMDDISILSIEAAEELADPSLNSLKESLDLTDDQYFQNRLTDGVHF